MAEGLWRNIGGEFWEAHSAGSKPSGYVHPLAVAVMRDRGVDISAGISKSVNDFSGQKFDLVITVCDHANEACPIFPGASERLHWPFEDPAEALGSDGQKKMTFARVRDEIEASITQFLELNC
jgi:arsenate reductase